MNDFAQIVSGLGDAARAIGAEVASVWVLIQLALLLLAAAAAAMIGALVRKRADLVALTMGWPSFLRLFARAIAANIGMIAFVAIVALMQVGMLARLTLMTLAILIVVRSTGIDLSALAIFTGALGVGVGFGLQKIVSNFVSGIILLVDKSIKPGDVITVGDSYGWVNAMNT